MITFTWQPYDEKAGCRKLAAAGTTKADARELQRLGLTDGASYHRRSGEEIKTTQRQVGGPRWKAECGALGWCYAGTPRGARWWVESRIASRCLEPFIIMQAED